MKTKCTFNIGWRTYIGAILTAFIWMFATVLNKLSKDRNYYDRVCKQLSDGFRKAMEDEKENKSSKLPAMGFNRYKD